jgi:outer membrane protein OmpA-like peptidoglycan-associated protein
MKRNLFLILLLSVVSVMVSAKDAKNYKTYQAAADASHATLKEDIEAGKLKQIKPLKKGLSKPTLSYKIVSTEFDSQANYEKKKKLVEAQKFAFEGNLTIKDSKTNDKVKYVAKGYFTVSKDSISEKVKGQKTKKVTIVYNEGQPVFVPEKLTRVPYFDSEAQKKAKDLVEAYYNQHKEFVKVNIGKVEPCELGYKVTTSRTFYKNEQQYTGNEGTVIFTVQKDAEQLDGFKLLEQTEENLTEFDNTPAPVEPTPEEPAGEDPKTTDSKASLDDLEQIIINGFKFNSIALSDENKEQLDQAAQILLSNSEVEIELLGHSCELGDKETNYNFGIMRAKEAKKYLVDKGIEAKRISVHSYGAKKPLVPNTTAENRAQNRRVEIKVIK